MADGQRPNAELKRAGGRPIIARSRHPSWNVHTRGAIASRKSKGKPRNQMRLRLARSHAIGGGKERNTNGTRQNFGCRRRILTLNFFHQMVVCLLTFAFRKSAGGRVFAGAVDPEKSSESHSMIEVSTDQEFLMQGSAGGVQRTTSGRTHRVSTARSADHPRRDMSATVSGIPADGHPVLQGYVSVKHGKQPLPACYSTPAANPSRGRWRRCKGGITQSPVDMTTWSAYADNVYGSLMRCNNTWVTDHASESAMPYYEWVAQDCTLDAVNAEKLCHVMEGRKGLLLVGDSLTRHMTTTMAGVLQADAIVGGADQSCLDEWSACGGDLRIKFQRNDYLDVRTERVFENGTRGFSNKHCEIPDPSKTRCTIFADDDSLNGFDTLVVNSGAHVRSPEVYGPAMDNASRTIAESMQRLHGKDKVILVVRNTAPGHWDCVTRMFKGPVKSSVAKALVASAPERYGYAGFEERNKLLEQAFISKRNGSDWTLLDVYTPTLLRPDMHLGGTGPDCLHYCMHGPMDHWVRLLYNIFLAKQARQAQYDEQ